MFQSTHSLRSATPYYGAGNTTERFQSTHSLRSATKEERKLNHEQSFQSTHSLRSATGSGILSLVIFAVSIHALLAECDAGFFPEGGRSCVSIHALLAECDCRCRQDGGLYTSFNPRTPCGVRRHRLKNPIKNQGFQSTHSLRSATSDCGSYQDFCIVSIHALLAECDTFCPRWQI